MSEGNETYSCFENKEARCRTETCEIHGIDPRSFCHSICAKPKHVCGNTACEKFVSKERDGGDRVVCIPRRKCKVQKHFGPSHEELGTSHQKEGKAMAQMQSKIRNESDKYEQGRPARADYHQNAPKKEYGQEQINQQKRVLDLAKNLSENIDAEGMAAINALAGSDICPCCDCKICQCKLRNVRSKSLQDSPLIRKEEDKLREVEEFRNRQDSSKDTRKRDPIKRELKGKGGLREEAKLRNRQDLSEDSKALPDSQKRDPMRREPKGEDRLREEEMLRNRQDLSEDSKALFDSRKRDIIRTELKGEERLRSEEEISRNTNDLSEGSKTLPDTPKQNLMRRELKEDDRLREGESLRDSQDLSEGPETLLDTRKGDLIRGELKGQDRPTEEEKLRNRQDLSEDSKNLLDTQKQDLIRRELNEEDRSREVEKLRERQDLSEDEKLILIEKIGDKYRYSFDYYNQPDLESYETERQMKLEKKRQEEIEEEKKAEQKGDERKRQEALQRQSRVEAEVQAEPETQEEGSQFYGHVQRKDLIDEFSGIPVVTDKVEEWDKDKFEEVPAAWSEYKAAEWAGLRHQDIPGVVETVTAEAMEKAALHFPTGSVSHSSRISPHTSSISTQKSVLPQIDLRVHGFDKSWLDDADRHSLRSPTSEIKPEIKKAPTAAETMQAMDYVRSPESSRSSHETTEEEEELSATSVESSDNKIVDKRTFSTDICNCLPGYCTCGKQHYTFKKETETEDFGMGFKTLQVDKIVPSTKEEREKLKVFSKGVISERSSCSCFHSEEDLAITPVVSKVEIVAFTQTSFVQPEVKKLRGILSCPPPKYQKSIIIVKPEAVQYKDVIFRAIKREGLEVLDERLIQLTPEQVAEIYTENFGSAYFPMFVKQLSSSPILVIAIAGANAIQRWNAVVGPEKNIPISWFYPASMRRRFSVHKDILDVMKISDDFQKAKAEIRYFFPLHIIDPIIISSTMVQDYCDKYIHPTLLKGLQTIVQRKPADPISFLAEWLLVNNPFQPFYKQIHVSLAPT